MSLWIASLNSGSNGNCYYVGNGHEAVLIDCGISCKETEQRMRRLGLNMETVKGIFVSHEHTDHISGIPVLARKYGLPVFVTTTTLRSKKLFVDGYRTIPFQCGESITIGGLSITPFLKFHDACDPHSFIVSGNNVTVGVFTDIGQACEKLVHYFRQCHAAFFEANYDTDMLMNGRYPYYLKQRISGGKGHLSNKQALDVFTAHKPPFMTHLLLAHLSKDNNNPELAQQLFQRHAGNTEVVIASRYEAVGPYYITGTAQQPAHFAERPSAKFQQVQLALF